MSEVTLYLKYPVDDYNMTDSFGWSGEGLRGYVYSTPDRSNVIISIKGTSPTAFGMGGTTSAQDKLNDNFMFSCCCSWTECGCSASGKCSEDCVTRTIMDWNGYYRMAFEIVRHIKTVEYPSSEVWLVGHSLGGALATVTAQWYGVYGIGFEAPGDAMFAHRIGLVPRPGTEEFKKKMISSKIYHVGNTGDPIFSGTCRGYGSSCYFSGYSVETKCHLGRSCVYSTGFQTINKHRMAYALDIILNSPLAKCVFEPDCQDCVEEGGMKESKPMRAQLSLSKNGV